MDDQIINAELAQNGVNRRSLMSQFGAIAATVMAVGAAVTSGAALTSRPAEAQGITDIDILNFALNLEYVEAQHYTRAFLGRGLDPESIRKCGVLAPARAAGVNWPGDSSPEAI